MADPRQRARAPRPQGSGLKDRLRRLPRWAWWVAAAVLFTACILSVSAAAGMAAGSRASQSSQSEAVAQSAQEQFDLGVEDLLATRYELAAQRFQYVLTLDPAYPGASELLNEALVGLNAPTTTPVPPTVAVTPTATLDVSSLDSLYQQAQLAFASEDWSTTIQALLTILARDPNFRRAEADSLMAAALQARGLQKIWSSQHEQGLYDLALAERFGALDSQASAWRSSAAFYLYANSFFGVVWDQAAIYFSQLCSAGGWDSCSKYAMAAMKYGDQLMEANDPCAAIGQYRASLDTRDNDVVRPTADHAEEACQTATARPPTPTITLTPTVGLPIETPTPTPTTGGPPPASPTPTNTLAAPLPTDTPTPTATATPSP
jgi:tetratricopeptide (TPR) repeat protein